jgi:hypothetical protein
MSPSLAVPLQLVAEGGLATLPCWHSAIVHVVATSDLAGGFLAAPGVVQARNGVEVEFSEGCPFLLGMFYRKSQRPEVLKFVVTQLSKQTSWLVLLEDDSSEPF